VAAAVQPGTQLIVTADPTDRRADQMTTFHDWRWPGTVITVVLMKFADYAMMRRMLRGIKERAETS
jgi:hypothetical protein